MLNASSESVFHAVFSKVRQLRASGLVISAGTAIFASRSGQLAALAAKHAVPTVSSSSAFTAAGGLVSYGADIVDAYRLSGGYVGRILKGEKPADLPVQQATKIELRINLKAAGAWRHRAADAPWPRRRGDRITSGKGKAEKM